MTLGWGVRIALAERIKFFLVPAILRWLSRVDRMQTEGEERKKK